MRTRPLAVIVTGLAVASLAIPASAKPKTETKSWDVTNPVPSPQGGTVPVGDGCFDGEEGVSKSSTEYTIPAKGVLKVELSGFVSDWDLGLFDAKGKMLVEDASDNSGSTGDQIAKVTYKKGTKGKKVSVVACNWAGGPTGKVKLTFTYA